MQDAPGTSFHYRSSDGLVLHAALHGSADDGRRPVVCLPGLTRNARDFAGLARHLAAEAPIPRRVIVFDYRGRGLSQYDADWRRYTLGVEMQDVLDGLAALGIDEADFVGTSRGGLLMHLIAAARPGLIGAAVLNDVGPELGREGLAQIKTYLTRPQEPAPRDFPEAAARQRAVHGEAFPALNAEDWVRLAHALYRERNGSLALDFDLALVHSLEALAPEGPLPELWPQFEMLAAVPLLVIRGENSRLLTGETLAEMERRKPDLEAIAVTGQGHAPLLETAELPAHIADFLRRNGDVLRRSTG